MTGTTTEQVLCPPTAPTGARHPLRGREDELARARRALEFGVDGGCALVTVEGPPGSGRTRFLDECAAVAQRLGFVTGHQFEHPGPARPPGADTAGRPRLVVLDDAHVLGEEPGEALLARRHAQYGGGALVRLVARRRGTVPGTPDALVAWPPGHTERISLDALRAPASLQVAADLLGAPPSAALARVLRRAGGHPKLLVELVEGMREEQLLRVGAHEAHLVEERIPRRLRTLLQSILLEYPDECRQLLRVAAVLGRESTVDDLLPILQVPPSVLLLVLDRAISTGMLAVGSTQVRFPNELLWRLIVDSVPVPLRQALRRQAADCRQVPRPGGPGGPPGPGTHTPGPHRNED
ncbi:P-loop NTPase family protein [Streptomyces pratensis]|uniref:hypothetical protein n=1 Tax=Streptomyces pratensis TaxID=1169025 RepID=UPI00363CF48D